MAKFEPGHPGGPGRPKGARSKLEEAFLKDMLADWEQNGITAIKDTREKDPATYVRVVAAILPKESKVDLTARRGESITEEHARLVAESYLESLRSAAGERPEESGGVHGHDAARLPAGIPASQDSDSPTAG